MPVPRIPVYVYVFIPRRNRHMHRGCVHMRNHCMRTYVHTHVKTCQQTTALPSMKASCTEQLCQHKPSQLFWLQFGVGNLVTVGSAVSYIWYYFRSGSMAWRNLKLQRALQSAKLTARWRRFAHELWNADWTKHQLRIRQTLRNLWHWAARSWRRLAWSKLERHRISVGEDFRANIDYYDPPKLVKVTTIFLPARPTSTATARRLDNARGYQVSFRFGDAQPRRVQTTAPRYQQDGVSPSVRDPRERDSRFTLQH